MAKESGVIH